MGEWEHYAAFHAWAQRTGGLATVNLDTGADADRLTERGYAAIATLLACALEHKPAGGDFRTLREGDQYYASTLQLLALAAANMRYNSCLPG